MFPSERRERIEPQPTESARIRELARQALQRVLMLDGRGGQADAEVRQLMRDACALARAQNLRAEQLLLVCKEVWRELPERLNGPRRDADELLGRVISRCIDEYYARQ